MSDFHLSGLIPTPTPNCPLCGGDTFLRQMHAAVAAVTNVFRCRSCHVEFPVSKKDAADTKR